VVFQRKSGISMQALGSGISKSPWKQYFPLASSVKNGLSKKWHI
jgi:hypothetical protein